MKLSLNVARNRKQLIYLKDGGKKAQKGLITNQRDDISQMLQLITIDNNTASLQRRYTPQSCLTDRDELKKVSITRAGRFGLEYSLPLLIQRRVTYFSCCCDDINDARSHLFPATMSSTLVEMALKLLPLM